MPRCMAPVRLIGEFFHLGSFLGSSVRDGPKLDLVAAVGVLDGHVPWWYVREKSIVI